MAVATCKQVGDFADLLSLTVRSPATTQNEKSPTPGRGFRKVLTWETVLAFMESHISPGVLGALLAECIYSFRKVVYIYFAFFPPFLDLCVSTVCWGGGIYAAKRAKMEGNHGAEENRLQFTKQIRWNVAAAASVLNTAVAYIALQLDSRCREACLCLASNRSYVKIYIENRPTGIYIIYTLGLFVEHAVSPSFINNKKTKQIFLKCNSFCYTRQSAVLL